MNAKSKQAKAKFTKVTSQTVSRSRHFNATHKRLARLPLENFESVCWCPHCADLGIHWLKRSWLPDRRNVHGEWVKTEVVERECKSCGFKWMQNK